MKIRAAAKKELKELKKELRKLVRGAGDLLGCDGTGDEADALVAEIRSLENFLKEKP